LAYDGIYLWTVYNTLGDEVTTTTLPPGAGTFTFKFNAPIPAPYGLAWMNNYLWVAGVSWIYKLDPSDGHTVTSLNDPDHFSYISGITFDHFGYLWVVDNDNDKIYKVDVGEHLAIPVPTVSEWSLFIMMVMLLAAGTLMICHRRKVRAV
jgi:hypothetical protein